MFGIEMTKDASYAAGPLIYKPKNKSLERGELSSPCAGDLPALKAIKYLF